MVMVVVSLSIVCRCASAICDIRQANTFLFIVFSRIKLQEESGYSEPVMICLHAETFAGKCDVASSRNRIEIDASFSIKRRTV